MLPVSWPLRQLADLPHPSSPPWNAKTSGALWITNILVQLFLILTLYSNSTYQALFYIASTAILVPYVLSGAYALKLAVSGEGYAANEGVGAAAMAKSSAVDVATLAVRHTYPAPS